MANPVERMPREGAAIAVFDTHTAAEAALRDLRGAGFPMAHLSLVGKDDRTEDHVIGYYNAGDRLKFWGRLGAFWGSVAGALFGSALLILPGVGHLFVFGPLAHWIVAGLEGAAVVGGVSALGAGLVSLGVPPNAVVQYETALRAGRFLLVAGGTVREVDQARDILRRAATGEVHDYMRAPAMAK